MKLKALVAGVASLVMTGTAAMAADIAPVVIPAPAPIVLPVAQTHDWGGFYVGGGSLLGGGVLVQGVAGFNLTPGNLVVGIEGGVAMSVPGGTFAILGATKVGVTLGASDRILAYGKGTLYYAPAVSIALVTLDGGVEVALGRRLSVFGEVGVAANIGMGGCCGVTFGGGVNFHFGR